MHIITYMWNLKKKKKKQTKEFNRNRLTDIENKLVVPPVEGGKRREGIFGLGN